MYGNSGIGKTSLIVRYLQDRFLDEYDPTLEDSYREQIDINGKSVLLQIWDFAAKEEFLSMRDQWLAGQKIYFMCFSITSKNSWNNIELYRERLLITKGDDTDWALVLVATKCDLEEYRQVSKEEILERAIKWNVPFVETSAKENKNVQHMFIQGVYAYWVTSQI